MSRHRKAYVISFHGTLCHDMSYITTIVASQLNEVVPITISVTDIDNA